MDDLTLRDKFAMAVIAGFVAESMAQGGEWQVDDWATPYAKEAYELADAMMAERGELNPQENQTDNQKIGGHQLPRVGPWHDASTAPKNGQRILGLFDYELKRVAVVERVDNMWILSDTQGQTYGLKMIAWAKID